MEKNSTLEKGNQEIGKEKLKRPRLLQVVRPSGQFAEGGRGGTSGGVEGRKESLLS